MNLPEHPNSSEQPDPLHETPDSSESTPSTEARETDASDRPILWARTVQIVLLLTLAALLVAWATRSCTSEPDKRTAEQKKKDELAKKKKKRKREYEFRRLETLPPDNSLQRNYVKPGHAVTAWVSAKANYKDFRGDFETMITDLSSRPVVIGRTSFYLVMSRPAVLPKGQQKFLELTLLIPPEIGTRQKSIILKHTLRAARSGQILNENSQAATRLRPHQYILAVLSANPNAYGYLKQLGSMKSQFDTVLGGSEELPYYHVVLPSVEQRVPMPTHPFAWTMVAYVLWDGLHPTSMTPDQQQAMIDWLHWGGQLIISGPASLDTCVGSFLDPYLPATSEQAIDLVAADFDALNKNWALASQKSGSRLALTLEATAPLIGISLKRRPGAEFVQGTGALVAERNVGKGRVVVTAFPLSHRKIINWKSFDSFFNGCLLRRPAREFKSNRDGTVLANWVGQRGRRTSPLYVSTTRYFTRDSGTHVYSPPKSPQANGLDVAQADWHWDGCEPHPTTGIGGWNDISGASKIAHETLKKAAGVSIPDARFVLSVLAVYLVVLVPVNWFVFRMLGRVEWAWVAAPIIAMIGAVVVIRLAQLDIGFVRSRTEISVIEMHGDYPRAHLTRYTALYCSLATNFSLQFDDKTAMVRPFASSEGTGRLRAITCRRDQGIDVNGYYLISSQTGFLHSEQMFDTGGAIQLVGQQASQWQVRNGSKLNLHHVGVLYCAPGGTFQTCWIGQLPAGTSASLNFAPAEKPDTPWLSQWETKKGAGNTNEHGIADLESLTNLAARGTRLRPGDVRLVAWVDGLLPGMTVEPSISQSESSGIVLVHLRRGSLPSPSPDKNILAEVRKATEELRTQEFEDFFKEDTDAQQQQQQN